MIVRPKFDSVRFSCPHCGALAHQHWHRVETKRFKKNGCPPSYSVDGVVLLGAEQLGSGTLQGLANFFENSNMDSQSSLIACNLNIAQCDSCSQVSVWIKERMIFPVSSPAGQPSKDMPKIVRDLFEEASAVFATSSKASAALLRLALQYLLIELGEEGKSINKDINNLIEKGLSDDVIEIMTVLRVVGNESVHPGTLSIDDNPEMAESLFEMLNQLVEDLITRPKKRKKFMDSLPKNKTMDVVSKLEKRKNN